MANSFLEFNLFCFAGTATSTAAGLAAGALAAAATSSALASKEIGQVVASSKDIGKVAAVSSAQVAGATAKTAAQNGLKYNPFGPGEFIFRTNLIQITQSSVLAHEHRGHP